MVREGDGDYLVQQRNLGRQMHALGKLPAARLREYTLHEVFCGGCSQALVTVLATDPFHVLRFRQQTGEKVRRGNWAWRAISTPPPPAGSAEDVEARASIIPAMCRCQQRPLSTADIFDSLRRGDRKRVIHPK